MTWRITVSTLVSLPLAAAIATMTPASAQAAGSCAPDSYAPNWHVFRSVAGRQYTQAISNTVVRNLDACDNSSDDEFSLVVAANLQGGSSYDFVQVGYGELNEGFGLRFVFTPTTGNGNLTYIPNVDIPIIGHEYQFHITRSTVTNLWLIDIRDLNAAGDPYIVNDLAVACNGDCTASKVWYGIEIENVGAQFGGASSGSPATLTCMGYQYVGDGTSAFTQLTGTTNAAWNLAPPTIPSSWNESISTHTCGGLSGSARLSGWDSTP